MVQKLTPNLLKFNRAETARLVQIAREPAPPLFEPSFQSRFAHASDYAELFRAMSASERNPK